MSRQFRLALAAAAIAVVVLVVVVVRLTGDDSDPGASPTTTAQETTTPTTTQTETEVTTTRPAPPRPTRVTIVIRNGRVRGGLARATVDRGERVVLVVRADVSDHVHLHGYDIMRDVAPGRPARLAFRATLPGRFEAELEDRGQPIAEIEVRP